MKRSDRFSLSLSSRKKKTKRALDGYECDVLFFVTFFFSKKWTRFVAFDRALENEAQAAAPKRRSQKEISSTRQFLRVF
jgi:hypothetical protein